MPDPTATVSTRPIAGADADAMSTLYPVPGMGFVPINAFVLRAREPVLIDTGPICFREQFFRALRQLIDPSELGWIYLTHADPDHVGSLRDVLAAAPRARLVTTFLGFGKLGLYEALSPDRVYLLNPGQRLSVGDRELTALEPATFDAPETTAFVDSKTGVLFSSDSFGGILAAPAETASDMTPTALADAVVTWTTIDSPWLGKIDERSIDAALGAIRAFAPPIVLSSHLPPAFGLLDVLIDHVKTARTRPRWVGPDQKALAAMLAAMVQRPPASPRAGAPAS